MTTAVELLLYNFQELFWNITITLIEVKRICVNFDQEE